MFEEKDGLLKKELPLVSGKESGCATVVEIGEGESRVAIGGGHFAMIAGPCSVESESQIISLAHSVKAAGANLLRGGAFKPRTSPYDFQGMGIEGLRLLVKAKEETGLPIVSEIMSEKYLDYFIENVDLIQIGSRNMQNFELLKALGRVRKPVMLKRGFSSTIREWLLSAEYLLSGGNSQVILCERGIRGFDSLTRNVLDLSAVPLVKRLSHLPLMVDPSHGTGRSDLVPTMAVAAVAAGADAIMVEVHDNPEEALSDGFQSLTPDQLADLCRRIEPVLNIR